MTFGFACQGQTVVHTACEASLYRVNKKVAFQAIVQAAVACGADLNIQDAKVRVCTCT